MNTLSGPSTARLPRKRLKQCSYALVKIDKESVPILTKNHMLINDKITSTKEAVPVAAATTITTTNTSTSRGYTQKKI